MTISSDRASADTTEPARPNKGAAHKETQQRKPAGQDGEDEEEVQQQDERFSPEEEEASLPFAILPQDIQLT
jgi:hypothetical protein